MGWRELSEAVFRQFLLQSPQERLAVAGYGKRCSLSKH
jgi:hypothetical protein